MAKIEMFTFGYEGLAIDDFIQRLRDARIQLILDVRELPLSRKKGFSKTAFREKLTQAGIGYQHLPTLGCPKPIRDQYRADSDWAAYTRSFLTYLTTVQSEVRSLALQAREQRACLVCYEADYQACHRTYVARAARQMGGPAVQHLTAKTMTPDLPETLAA
jgi:uncharacterized protein (DUF488 family)